MSCRQHGKWFAFWSLQVFFFIGVAIGVDALPEPVFYVPFEGEQVTDVIGGIAARSERGGSHPRFVPGRIGQAMSFAADSAFWSYDVTDVLDPEAGTIAFWYKPQNPIAGTGILYGLLDWHVAGDVWQNALIVTIRGQGDFRFDVHRSLPDLRPTVFTEKFIDPNEPMRWYHFAVSWGGADGPKIYRDGELLANVNNAGDPVELLHLPLHNANESITLRFGGNQRRPGAAGVIDEVKLYDQAMDAQQVAALFATQDFTDVYVVPKQVLSISELVKRLDDSDPVVRLTTVEEILASSSEVSEAISALLPVLNDPNSSVAFQALLSLRVLMPELAPYRAVEDILTHVRLENDSAQVREAAARALARRFTDTIIAEMKGATAWEIAFQTEPVLELLNTLLDQAFVSGKGKRILVDHLEEIVQTANAIWMDSQEVTQCINGFVEDNAPLLMGFIQGEDEVLRDGLLRIFSLTGSTRLDIIDALVEGRRAQRTSTRQMVVSALAAVASERESVVDALIEALSDSDDEVRWQAITGLRNVGGQSTQVVAAIAAALEDDCPAIRRVAAEALGSAGHRGAVAMPRILAMVEDESEDLFVRRAAYRTLLSLGETSGNEGVAPALGSLEPSELGEAQDVRPKWLQLDRAHWLLAGGEVLNREHYVVFQREISIDQPVERVMLAVSSHTARLMTTTPGASGSSINYLEDPISAVLNVNGAQLAAIDDWWFNIDTFDITDSIAIGTNTLQAIVRYQPEVITSTTTETIHADGSRSLVQPGLGGGALIAQIYVEYADGSNAVICSDSSWQTAQVLSADHRNDLDWSYAQITDEYWGDFRFYNKEFAGPGFAPIALGSFAPGLYVMDGTLMKDERPYFGVGINYSALFGLRNRTDLECITWKFHLAEMAHFQIPFIRAWFSMYNTLAPGEVFSDAEKYYMDEVIHTLEKYGIGLIPVLGHPSEIQRTLRGETEGLTDYVNTESATYEAMNRRIAEIVNRYKGSAAIWGWQFWNEGNLKIDHPNAPETHAEMVTSYYLYGQQIRKYDPYRHISSGNAAPPPAAWHLRHHGTWTHDSRAQFRESIIVQEPFPLDTSYVHVHSTWSGPEELVPAGDVRSRFGEPTLFRDKLEQIIRAAEEANRPLFLGEIGQPQFYAEKIDMIVERAVPLTAAWQYGPPAVRVFTGTNENRWLLWHIHDAHKRLQAENM